MKIQFASVLKDRHGVDYTEVFQPPGQPASIKAISLGDVCCSVLDMVFQDESQEGLKPKLRRAELIDKITAAEKTSEPLELLEVDIDMLKERIGKRNLPTGITIAAIRLFVNHGETGDKK